MKLVKYLALVALVLTLGSCKNQEEPPVVDSTTTTSVQTPVVDETPYDVVLTLNEELYSLDVKQMTVSIQNNDSRVFMYTLEYAIEVFENDAWVTYKPEVDCSWIDMAFEVESGASSECILDVSNYNFQPGHYRVSFNKQYVEFEIA